MPNIKPISDLRNYTEVLKEVTINNPVFLTKNGRGQYYIACIDDFEKEEAARRLVEELDRAHRYADEKGWIPWEDVKRELGISCDEE